MGEERFAKQSHDNDYVMGLIRINKLYMIFRQEYNSKIFYKVQITKKNFDGTEIKSYMPVTFKKGVELDNKSIIKIKKAIENWYPDKNNKYENHYFYNIIEFQLVKNEKLEKEQALDAFQADLANRGNNSFIDFGDEVTIDDNFLD